MINQRPCAIKWCVALAWAAWSDYCMCHKDNPNLHPQLIPKRKKKRKKWPPEPWED